MLRKDRANSFFIIRNQFDACLSIALVEQSSRDAFSRKSFRFIPINMQHKIGYQNCINSHRDFSHKSFLTSKLLNEYSLKNLFGTGLGYNIKYIILYVLDAEHLWEFVVLYFISI